MFELSVNSQEPGQFSPGVVNGALRVDLTPNLPCYLETSLRGGTKGGRDI